MGKLRVFLQMFLLPCNILLIDKQICLSVIEYVCLFIHILYLDFFLSDFEDLFLEVIFHKYKWFC